MPGLKQAYSMKRKGWIVSSWEVAMQGGTREPGKDQLDSLRSARETLVAGRRSLSKF